MVSWHCQNEIHSIVSVIWLIIVVVHSYRWGHMVPDSYEAISARSEYCRHTIQYLISNHFSHSLKMQHFVLLVCIYIPIIPIINQFGIFFLFWLPNYKIWYQLCNGNKIIVMASIFPSSLSVYVNAVIIIENHWCWVCQYDMYLYIV